MIFRAIWPVIDQRPLHVLVCEAKPDLPRLLAVHRARPLSRPSWALRPGREVPGSRGADVVLVMEVRCEALPLNVDALQEAILPKPAQGAVDEIAVERATRGEPVRLTRAEQLEAVRLLAARRESASVIARRLRMSGSRTREILTSLGAAS